MATINENINQLVKTEAELREIISLCYAPVADKEGLTSYPDKLARLAVDDPTPEVIGIAPRVTAGGRMISDSISSVRKIYGETRKFNQLVNLGKGFQVTYCTLEENNGVYKLTYTKNVYNPGYGARANSTNNSLVEGHKYLFGVTAKTDENLPISFGMINTFGLLKSGFGAIVNAYSEWKSFCYITEAYYYDSNYGSPLGVGAVVDNKQASSLYFKNLICIDITSIYGAGKEPTTEDQFCQDYFGCNADQVTDEQWAMLAEPTDGALLNSAPKSIVSKPKTILWNQLVKNGNFADGTNDWSSQSPTKMYMEAIGNGSLKVTITEDSYKARIRQFAIFSKDHIYNVSFDYYGAYSVNNAAQFIIRSSPDTIKNYGETPNNVWLHFGFTIKANGNATLFDLFSNSSTQSGVLAGDYCIYKNICIFDLTQMFGEGNEPTDEEFRAMFPADYYPYNEGEELTDKLEQPWESTLEIDPKSIRNENGEQVFPDGLLSAGEVCDEIDWERGVAVKRIGSVDLSSLTYRYNSENLVFYAINRNQKAYYRDLMKATPVVCPKYITHSVKIAWADFLNLTDGICRKEEVTYSYIAIKDTNYSTIDALKQSLIGVLCYFELVTPIEYPLPASWRKSWMRVANGGTERITADGMTLPLHADIAYRTADEKLNVIERCDVLTSYAEPEPAPEGDDDPEMEKGGF